jgi:replicative DNA helicase
MIRLSNNNNAATNDKISFETDGWGTNSSEVTSSLSILSSRPAMGKTSFAIQLACTVNPGVPFLYISNETITNKTIAHLTGISLDKINSTNLSIKESVAVTKANQKLKSMALNVLENIQLTTKDSLQTIRQVVISKQPKGVIIDGINWRDFKNSQDRKSVV